MYIGLKCDSGESGANSRIRFIRWRRSWGRSVALLKYICEGVDCEWGIVCSRDGGDDDFYMRGR